MVQSDTDQDGAAEGMDAESSTEASWTAAIRTAVQDFVSTVSESSLQLASAAEHFAGESLQTATQARQAADTSTEMATAAGQSATEARTAVESLTLLAEQANQAANEASEQARQAVTSIEQASIAATNAMNESSATAVQSVEASVAAAIESLDASAKAASEQLREEANLLSERLTADIVLQTREALEQIRAAEAERQVPDISPQAQEALDQIRSAASESQDALAAAQQAALEARTAANDSLAHSERALEVAASPTVGAGAQEVLERLEVDYDLLTRLVQELHTRIVNLTAPVVAPSPPQIEAVDSYEPLWEPEPEPEAEIEPDMSGEPEWPSPIYQGMQEEPAEIEPEPAVLEPVASVPPAVEEVPQPTMAGRVMVTIGPVPDFDRLLNLDGALGRMRGIVNVSLADYAKEEVTFRLEVESPMSADDFARSLSESAGSSASVAGTEEGKLALRLAS